MLLRVRSLAKINLDLRVLRKQPDDYHDIRTVFQTISLADTIAIECQRGRTKIDIKSNINIPGNLIVSAADSVLKATKSTARLVFELKKRIPMGGGLGGGSSNAAAILLALPAMLGKKLSFERLHELASELGSDVPFFLMGGTAVGLGRGTELYPLPDLTAHAGLLVTPGIHVSTPDAYRGLNRQVTSEQPRDILNSFQAVVWRIVNSSDASDWNPINEFETIVFRQHPQLELIKGKLLRLGARPALMSGSGSTLFGIFKSRVLRDRAVGFFRREFAENQVHPVALVGRSRYRALWRRQTVQKT